MVIAGNEIAPGKNAHIRVNVAGLPSGTEIHINTHVYRSKNPGPTILLLGGMHGDEVNGRTLGDPSGERVVRGLVEEAHDVRECHGGCALVSVHLRPEEDLHGPAAEGQVPDVTTFRALSGDARRDRAPQKRLDGVPVRPVVEAAIVQPAHAGGGVQRLDLGPRRLRRCRRAVGAGAAASEDSDERQGQKAPRGGAAEAGGSGRGVGGGCVRA